MATEKSVDSIFIEAISIENADDRSEFIRNACSNSVECIRRVERLMDADRRAPSFLEKPAIALDQTSELEELHRLGDHIGPYKLLQKLGEGGMGIVYMADQLEPVKRRVALKVIKPGMDSRQVIARFEAERQALAMMDHPNIARVLDAGTTTQGHPFFVMELVKGLPLTIYCDENHLDVQERLDLFVQVCDAVQHAHQKGVIHRDLKPSNVLVAEYDHNAVPKIIDFGVAKALNQQLTEKTMFTQYGQIVGTPEYMSPEQAKLNQLDIDTRSDIYSLGVLLYELLTGDTPFDKERLRSAAFDELIRIIREEEPPRPSTRLKSSATLPAIASARRMPAPRLTSVVRGELDWIIMKALAKDRSRRYESTSALSADIQAYLSNEQVSACPPSTAYVLRRFAKQHRGAVAILTTVLATLLVGSIGIAWQAVRATRAERRANEALSIAEENVAQLNASLQRERSLSLELTEEKDRAVRAEAKAEKESRRAKQEAAIAQATTDLLLKDILGRIAPSPEANRGWDVKLVDVLNAASEKLNENNGSAKESMQPSLEAAVRHAIGSAYFSLSKFEEASPHLEQAYRIRSEQLKDSSPEALESLHALAMLRYRQGRRPEAEEMWEELLKQYAIDSETYKRRIYEIGFRQAWLGSIDKLAEFVTSAIDEFGSSDPLSIRAKSSLAAKLSNQERWEEAEEIYQEVMEVYRSATDDHLKLAIQNALTNYGFLLGTRGKLLEQERIFREAYLNARTLFGESHPSTLLARNNYAFVLDIRGQHEQAEDHARKTISYSEQSLGKPNHVGAHAYDTLGSILQRSGRLEEASNCFLESWRQLHALSIYGQAEKVLKNAVGSLRNQGRMEDAHLLFAEVVDECLEAIMDDTRDNLAILGHYGTALNDLGYWVDAELIARKWLERISSRNSPKDRIWPLIVLSETLHSQQRFEEALEYSDECSQLAQQHFSDDHFVHHVAKSIHGRSLAGIGKQQEAETLIAESLISLDQMGARWHWTGKALKRAVDLYAEWENHNFKDSSISATIDEAIESKTDSRLDFVLRLIWTLLEKQQYEQAAELANRLADAESQAQNRNQPSAVWSEICQGRALTFAGDLPRGEYKLRHGLELCNQLYSESNTQKFYVMLSLGQNLRRQGRYDEAAKLLKQAYDGNVQYALDARQRLAAVKELIQLYSDQGAEDSNLDTSSHLSTWKEIEAEIDVILADPDPIQDDDQDESNS